MFGFGDINAELKLVSGNILNMIVFDKFKTGKPVIDAFVTTIVLTGVTYLFQFINNNFTKFIKMINIFDCEFESFL